MQPIEIRIAGAFYDSQIYSGELYLWTIDGDMLCVDWDKLVDSIKTEGASRATLEFAFRRSEYLYDPNVAILLEDPEIKTLLQGRFASLSTFPIHVSPELLESCTKAKYRSPFGFPHADTGFYSSNLFVAGRDGVEYEGSQLELTRLDLQKVTDIPTLGISLGSSRLAIAAGDEGAYQVDVYPTVRHKCEKVMERYTNSVRWMESSLFASGRVTSGTFVDFKPRKKNQQIAGESTKQVRELVSIDRLDTNPNNEGVEYAWGAEDRLCLVKAEYIDVHKFYPRRKLAERFQEFGRLPFRKEQIHEVVSADNAIFGFVLEHVSGLEVFSSSNQTFSLLGEPVNWRVFPRSKYYTNQLHVVREEYMSVLSFNEDFFVDQETKLSGVEHKSNLPYGRRARAGRPEPLHIYQPLLDDEFDDN